MSFARGKFGLEYNTVRRDDDSSGLLPKALVVAFLVALVSLVATVVSRRRAAMAEAEALPDPASAPVAETVSEPPPAIASDATNAVPDEASAPMQAPPVVEPKPVDPELPPPEKIEPAGDAKRPAKVRNLLMRLEEAEKRRDVAMAVSTIEQLRALPGDPAADLDDALARRLGVLNMRWLFGSGKSPWVAEVVIRRGDNASRIAHEHGSTLASLKKLNGGDADKLIAGKTLRVMDHPRFSLVVHRRTRTADLSLNGKFFKRYDLSGEVTGAVGAYEVPERPRQLLKDKGITLKPADRAELETLLPRGASILIAEL